MQPRLPKRGEVSLGLVLGRSELGVERAEYEIQIRERRVVHVEGSVGEHVELDRAKDPEWVAQILEPAIDRVDRAALFGQLVRRHAVRDLQRLGVVRDGHVRPAEGSRHKDHLVEGQAAVAERGVHLEIGAGIRLPSGIGVERPPDLGVREESASRLVGLGHRWRIVEPAEDPFRHPRSHGGELGEGTARVDELARFLGPESRRPRGSLQRPAAMVRLITAGAPQQLAQVGVGQHLRQASHVAGCDSAFDPRTYPIRVAMIRAVAATPITAAARNPNVVSNQPLR